MKLVFSLIFILFGLISYSQVEYFELEYAPDEHYFLKSKLSPLGEWDTIYLDDLKTLLGITSGGVSDGVVDTVFIDKNELNIEVLTPDSTTR
jgi:hypothetical protein